LIITSLFADDTLLYKHIRNDNDAPKLKGDLSALEEWESKWHMSCHPEKCTVLRITTGKRNCRQTSYYLHGQLLQVPDGAKYLSVTLSDDLQWEKQAQATAARPPVPLDFSIVT
jgi:myo-inositol-hexaphosphate 3-phosphohydrolase